MRYVIRNGLDRFSVRSPGFISTFFQYHPLNWPPTCLSNYERVVGPIINGLYSAGSFLKSWQWLSWPSKSLLLWNPKAFTLLSQFNPVHIITICFSKTPFPSTPSLSRGLFPWDFLALKMEKVCFSETLVFIYESTRHQSRTTSSSSAPWEPQISQTFVGVFYFPNTCYISRTSHNP
jgi:hypothetical protein